MWMYPYRQAKVDEWKGNCNYRLCRARRVMQNVFGIFAQKWWLYHRPLGMHVQPAKSIVKATCVSHNYLTTKSCDSKYNEYLEHSEPVMGVLTGTDMEVRRGKHVVFHTRQKFTDFFN
jgi:hypothetical protein